MKNISPQKNDKKGIFLKKLILFIILFVLVDTFFTRPLRRKIEENQREKAIIAKEEGEENLNDNEEEKIVIDNKIIEPQDIILENEYIKLTVNTKGLLLDNLILKKYNVSVDDESKVKLLEYENKENFNYISVNWFSNDESLKLPNKNSIWVANKTKLEDANDKIVFSYNNNEGIIFKIILSLDDKYMINVEQIVENNTSNRIYLKPIWQIQKRQKMQDKNELSSFSGPIGVFNNKMEEIKEKKLKKNNIEFEKFNWAGITSKYWLTAIVNEDFSNGKINILKINNILKVQYATKNNLIISGNSFSGTKGKIFAGAKDFNILREYQVNNNIKLFERSIDFGFFYFLSKPLFLILNFFYKIANNFGIAIIFLTLIIKMLLYSNVKKSFVSMAKMKKIQPEMKRLQEVYKNDKITLQQELVKLYKKYDLNPLASIAPIFIQIPVFFSLYKVISISLAMRQAPFFGYIKDLSVGDPTSIFNLFGLLPYNAKITVGFLPCLMCLTMYIQQKITENMQGKQEFDSKSAMGEQMQSANKMMKFMPIIFLFIFSGFPSGLLIYWIFNNIITILQQIYIGIILKKQE